MYLVDGEHLTVALLNLLQLPQEVPNPDYKLIVKRSIKPIKENKSTREAIKK